jgi:hypothetical protein
MCLNGTNSKVRIGKTLSDAFPIHKGMKQGDIFSPLFFIFASQYCIRNAQENAEGLEFQETHQILFYAEDVNILGENMNTVRKIKEYLLQDSKEIGLELNTEKAKHIVVSSPNFRTRPQFTVC